MALSRLTKYRCSMVLAAAGALVLLIWLVSTLTPMQVRATNTVLGCAAFGLITYRVVGRWPLMSRLSRCVVCLLALAVLVNGLGAARAAQLHAAFNELAYGAMLINFGVCAVGLVWQRWLDPTGERT